MSTSPEPRPEDIAAHFGPDAAAAILEAVSEPFTAYQDPSPVPYTLTARAEALLDVEPEAEARAMTAVPKPYPVLAASDLGRFEPTPYDLGITDNPDAVRAAFPGLFAGAPEPEPELGP